MPKYNITKIIFFIALFGLSLIFSSNSVNAQSSVCGNKIYEPTGSPPPGFEQCEAYGGAFTAWPVGCQDTGWPAPCKNKPGYRCETAAAAVCTPTCFLDYVCTDVCGDKVADPLANEGCDFGTNNDTGNCQYNTINQAPCSSCDSHCNNFRPGGIPIYCGDGIRQNEEQCDTGLGVFVDTPTCDYGSGVLGIACTLPVCGDGYTNLVSNNPSKEECDDANASTLDECTNTCTRTYCGDSIVQSGALGNGTNLGGPTNNGREECDTGLNTLGCVNCALTYCGDGITQNPNGRGTYGTNNIGDEFCDLNTNSCNKFVAGIGTYTGTETCFSDCSTYNSCVTGTCGDGTCENSPGPENAANCAADCTSTCGDSLCVSPENPDNCLTDCPAVCGDGTCNGQETLSTCPSDCSVCGDTIITPPEICEGNNYGQETCSTQTSGARPSGNLSCSGCTTINNSQCYQCGNGNKEGPEECDDGNTVTETTCDYGVSSCTACRNDCMAILDLTGPTCGDAILDNITSSEVCDLGILENNNPDCPYGTTSCNVCLSDCKVEKAGLTSFCGDNILDTAQEDCDYNPDPMDPNGDGCDTSCNVQDGYTCGNFGVNGSYTCLFHCGSDADSDGDYRDVALDINGDGSIDVSENCDSGPENGSRCIPKTYGSDCTWCTSSCEIRTVAGSRCGDGSIDKNNEGCDDGNTSGGDGCNGACNIDTGWECSGVKYSKCKPINGDGICTTDFENCKENYGDCGPCQLKNIFTAKTGQFAGALSGVLKNIADIFPIPQLKIGIPGLNLINRAGVNAPLEVEVKINGFGIRTPFFIGGKEINVRIEEYSPGSSLINFYFE
ncbi:MAG: hypothetical protein Q8O88_00210 [bacterium]|nr:hypothetical protein [bacterium]